MLRLRKMLLLTGIACLGLLFSNPIEAHASSCKILLDSETKLEDTISSIKLGDVNIGVIDGSPFSFDSISTDIYHVVTKSGERVCKFVISEEVDDITQKILKCEKSNFIGENIIVTEITHDEVENGTVTTYKENDRKVVVFTNGTYYVKLSSFVMDEIIYGNNYINKVLDNITIRFDEE